MPPIKWGECVKQHHEAQGVPAVERSVGRKVLLHLVVPAAFYVLMGAIDRTNVGFAALDMNRALGLSGTQYGFGAGVLFVGYMLAKYPSVLLYEAIGMRRWLTAITAAWGLASCAMAMISTEWQLYGLRVLIGFAEGGLSSGTMLYLSQWAPERYRASILAIPITSISVAQVIGAPVSGLLLDLDHPLGMESWRLMFLAEALPALALAAFAWLHFPDRRTMPAGLRPRNARGSAATSKARRSLAPCRTRTPPGRAGRCCAIRSAGCAAPSGSASWLPTTGSCSGCRRS
jgi:ACS family tartrate transporter-like MFS transporter